VHDDGSQQLMSSYDGLQVVQDDYEAPIPALQDSYEKGPKIGVERVDGTPSGKPILGMGRKIFWLVLAIVVVVIMAAVGGGVGGSLANKKTKSSGQPVTQRLGHHSVFTYFMLLLDLDLQESSSGSATPSTASRTSATSTASTPSATTNGYTGCPDVNGTLFTASSGAKFIQYCNYDIHGREINFDEQATQSLDDYINLCDITNARNNNTGCKAVTYNFAGRDYWKCWLKNGTETLEANTVTGGNSSVAAVLV
jgi:hypothetical protein